MSMNNVRVVMNMSQLGVSMTKTKVREFTKMEKIGYELTGTLVFSRWYMYWVGSGAHVWFDPVLLNQFQYRQKKLIWPSYIK